ncbi:MAG TPA: hypothetical protein PLS66_09145, partial [Tepiditoga sp.]|nr:hypothetical protein [Tepiditoga sp.]
MLLLINCLFIISVFIVLISIYIFFMAEKDMKKRNYISVKELKSNDKKAYLFLLSGIIIFVISLLLSFW